MRVFHVQKKGSELPFLYFMEDEKGSIVGFLFCFCLGHLNPSDLLEKVLTCNGEFTPVVAITCFMVAANSTVTPNLKDPCIYALPESDRRNPLCVFCKVLLAHSHTYSFAYCLEQLSIATDTHAPCCSGHNNTRAHCFCSLESFPLV